MPGLPHFVQRVLLFVLAALLAYSIFYALYFRFTLPKAAPALYAWGDSQMCEGLALPELKKRLGMPVYSAAQHGAGVYDFLAFAYTVPAGSQVLVSVSRPLILRHKQHDRNQSTLSVSSLWQLLTHGYGLPEVYDVVKKNGLPMPMFREVIPPFKQPFDSIAATKQLRKVFEHEPEYMQNKQQLFQKGLDVLLAKGCAVVCIYFPNQPLVQQLEKTSPMRPGLTRFDDEIMAKTQRRQQIVLTGTGNIFDDYVHLNPAGAMQLTTRLAPLLDGKPMTVVVEVK